MNEVLEYLKDCGTFYIATCEGSQPRVRPFGAVCAFEGKLYIQTGKGKPVSDQMTANPKIEICAFQKGQWLRIQAVAVEDDRVEARKSMLDAYPNLRKMYDENDGRTQVFYLKDAVATFSSFTAPSRTVTF